MIETVDVADVFGNTIFCDDIRFEQEGKVSFIGSYGTSMQVNGAFPAVLPKFGFGVFIWQKFELADRDAKIQIYLPGDADGSPSMQAGPEADALPNPSPDTKFLVMAAHLLAVPLALKAPGTIRVRALVNGKLHRLGSLLVTQGPTTPPTA
jgi:hypothetical protein